MKDIQSSPAEVSLSIDRVGVQNLRLPLIVRDREAGTQHTVARVDLGVDLPSAFKGTHMSRFVEALENWTEELHYETFRNLLADVAKRLAARRAHVRFRFPYFLKRSSPVSRARSLMGYDCQVEGEWEAGELTLSLGVEVPVMTVCPCSLAISEQGAHSQRALVRIRAGFSGFLWLEDLIEIAENAGSSPVYSLLKRQDEKHVTEAAFANPVFVEDVVRKAASDLAAHSRVEWFKVEAESFESIHDHSAYAVIEKKSRDG